MLFEFGSFQVNIDVESTKAFYDEHGKSVLEDCGCVNCRNYYEAVAKASDKVSEFFRSIGIDPQKTPEATWWNTDENGIAHYSIIFHLVGTIIQSVDIYTRVGDNGFKFNIEDFYEIEEGFKIGFSSKAVLVEKDFPEPCIQLEIVTCLPWVLD